MAGKPLFFVGAALEDLRAFPDEARLEAGHQLYRVQLGQMPNDWKPMSSVGEKKSHQTRRADIEVGRARLKTLDQLEET